MKKPFLTIGIPTWNRLPYLQKNVEGLIRQILSQQLTDSVEIFISDNASTDDSAAFLSETTQQHSFVRAYSHSENRGANANFQFVIESAQAEYVWLLGDDDLLAENVIARVITDIKTNHPDVIVGPAVYDNTQEKATHQDFHHVTLTDQSILAKEDLILLAGKMSGLIFRKESVLPVLSLAGSIIHQTRTPWPHLAWLLLVLNDPAKKLLVLPYGINQLVAANWFNLLFDGKTLLTILFIDYQALLLALKPLLSAPLYQALISHSVVTRQASLLKCVLYGTYLDSYGSLLRLACVSFLGVVGVKNKVYYFMFLILPLLIPNTIRKIIYWVCQMRWKKLRITIARIQAAKKILQNNHTGAVRQFNDQQL
jgi:glycosyltransferase involved in cell wall biosynthesis